MCVPVSFLGTFHLPQWKRDAHQEYLKQHIEGAVRFDLAEVCDKSNPLPHMLPPASQFEEQVGKVHYLHIMSDLFVDKSTSTLSHICSQMGPHPLQYFGHCEHMSIETVQCVFGSLENVSHLFTVEPCLSKPPISGFSDYLASMSVILFNVHGVHRAK